MDYGKFSNQSEKRSEKRKAVSLISPVLVSAVKRGGGIVVSALFGAVFFGEKLRGRIATEPKW